jgi:hypothetical protein
VLYEQEDLEQLIKMINDKQAAPSGEVVPSYA